jgi:GDP-4-dehydro-6-deoxy-D-mannose reductase
MVDLVTGAEGFIGSHLIELLLSQGRDVVGTYFNSDSLWRLDGVRASIGLEELDIRDGPNVDRVFGEVRPDVVYHLAAQSLPTVSWAEPVRTMETNATGTVHVFEAVRTHNPDAHVMVACSSAEYGLVGEEDVPTPEDHPLRPLHPYGVSKVAQDLLAYQYHHNFATKAHRARIYNTTGPRKEADVLADFTQRVVDIERGRTPPKLRVGNLDTRRDFTDVRDMVRALVLLVEKGRPGIPYNMCTGQVHLVSELLGVILENARTEIEVFQDPDLMRPSDEPIIAGDNTRLLTDTGWRPEIAIEDTIRDMLDFWRAF